MRGCRVEHDARGMPDMFFSAVLGDLCEREGKDFLALGAQRARRKKLFSLTGRRRGWGLPILSFLCVAWRSLREEKKKIASRGGRKGRRGGHE